MATYGGQFTLTYSFTSPEVAGALISAKRRGVDVRGGGTGLESQYREKQ